MPTLLRDGECDAACNTESCDWDEGDCFHHHGLAARKPTGEQGVHNTENNQPTNRQQMPSV